MAVKPVQLLSKPLNFQPLFNYERLFKEKICLKKYIVGGVKT